MSQKQVKQINLNSNVNRVAKNTSIYTVNAWGSVAVKKDFYVANNGSNTLVKYSKKGAVLLTVNTTNPPTGLVYNKSQYFQGYQLITAGENGVLEGYKPLVDPVNTAVILTVPNAIFKGLAIGNNRLYVTNFADTGLGGGNVIIYDTAFNVITTFTDADLIAAGYYPFNVAVHHKKVYVTFARKDGDDEQHGTGFGYVDVFDLNGIFKKRLINRTGLNAGWAMLFSQCGKFLYVGNFGDGTISIYDSQCGTFL